MHFIIIQAGFEAKHYQGLGFTVSQAVAPHPAPRYNLPMNRSAAEVLEDVRRLRSRHVAAAPLGARLSS
jgi:hypothetical protein